MQTEPKRLYRSRTDRMVAGVCSGLGAYLNLDATVVRLLFVLLAILTSGVPVLVAYLILMVVVPEEPASNVSTAAPVGYAATVDTSAPAEPDGGSATVVDVPPSPEI